MRISARADYAVRAALDLTTHFGKSPRSAESIALDGSIPASFLEAILTALRKGGIVESRRGAHGGYLLARPPAEITVADIVRSVDGPLVFVRDARPSDLEYNITHPGLLNLWVALRASVRSVLDETTLLQLSLGELPPHVTRLLAEPGAWENAPLEPS